MSTVRRPFLDAYRHAEAPPIRAHQGEGSISLGTSATAMGGAFDNPAESQVGWQPTEHATLTREREMPRATRPATKRPLSSFLHNFDQPVQQPAIPSPRQQPTWPATSLDLLASAAPAYDKLIARFARGTAQGSLIGIFGCGASVGTTTTAICLALRSATHGASTLLVDADLASPALGERLGLPVNSPWTRSLKEGTPLERAIVPGGEVAIDLLLNHPQAGHELDPWARFHVGNAAGQMRRRYEHTLVDLGYHQSLADEVIGALAIDEVILVAGPATTTEEEQQIQHSFASQGQHVSGILRAA